MKCGAVKPRDDIDVEETDGTEQVDWEVFMRDAEGQARRELQALMNHVLRHADLRGAQ